MKKVLSTLLIASLSVIVLASAAGAAGALPGVPVSASIVAAGFISEKHRETIVKAVDSFIGSEPYKKFCETFEERSKIPFPSGVFDALKKTSSFSLAIFPDQRGMQHEPRAMALYVTFDDEASATNAFQKAVKKIVAFTRAGGADSKVKIDESAVDGLAMTRIAETVGSSKKSIVAAAFSSGKTVGAVLYPSEKEAEAAEVVKQIAAAFKDEKAALAGGEKFKNALASIGESSSGIVYFDAELIAAGKSGEDKKIAELINYVAIGLDVAGDFSRISANSVFSINQIKSDPKAAQGMDLLNAVLAGGQQNAAAPAAVLPSNMLALLGTRLNINQETLALPSIAPSKASFAIATGGLKIEDLLSWFTGDVFAGIGDYSLDLKAMMDKNPETPDFYLGFGTSSKEKAGEFFDRVIDLMKKRGVALEFADEKANNINVKTAEIKKSPFKNFVLTAGCVGDYFVIASNRNAFANLVVASSKPEMSLKASKDFSDVVPAAPASAYFYLNAEKIFRFADLMALLNPQLKGFSTAGFIRQIALTLTFKPESGGASKISASVAMRNDVERLPVGIVLEMIDAALSKIRGTNK